MLLDGLGWLRLLSLDQVENWSISISLGWLILGRLVLLKLAVVLLDVTPLVAVETLPIGLASNFRLAGRGGSLASIFVRPSPPSFIL